MKSENRILQYDLLRILACFSVVMLHTSAQFWYEFPLDSMTWKWANFYDSVNRFGVPIFVMLSGALFLDGAKEISVKKLLKKHILRMTVIYFVWSAIYAVFDNQVNGWADWDPENLKNSFVNPKYHLWFIPMIIGLYFVVPVLRSWLAKAERKNIEYFLGLFLIFQIGRETLMALFEYSKRISAILSLGEFDMICSYIGYFVLGYYMIQYGLKDVWKKWIYVGAAASVILCPLLSYLLSVSAGEPKSAIFDSNSVFTFLIIVTLFEVFVVERKPKRLQEIKGAGFITQISADTLGIYLMHVAVLEFVRPMKVSWMVENIWISIPLLAVFTFVVCCLMAAVVRRIPILGKYVC